MSSNLPSRLRRCPDCGGELGDVSLATPGAPAGLTYAEPSKAKGLWNKMTERRPFGSVHALMCQGCHRIFLYGVPVENPD